MTSGLSATGNVSVLGGARCESAEGQSGSCDFSGLRWTADPKEGPANCCRQTFLAPVPPEALIGKIKKKKRHFICKYKKYKTIQCGTMAGQWQKWIFLRLVYLS